MRTNNRAGAIIIRDNRMLLIHRRKYGKEYWVLVGGGVEEGETIEQALEREVGEETGLTLVSFKKATEIWIDNTNHIVFECETNMGQPVLGGPEKEAACEDNWYNLEWVEIEKVAGITDIYPSCISGWSANWIREHEQEK